MSHASELADFALKSSYEDLSDQARLQLKVRLLDALGCAIGALDGEPIRMLSEYVAAMGGNPTATIFGGIKTSPCLAALYNSALIRYLDFNDSYLAKGETCHPSDNIGALLAAAEYNQCHGKDFLVALALAYQVQCRLSDVAPVRAKGFDHTTQGAYGLAAALAKLLGLNAAQAANAIAISGTANNALRVTRTGSLSHWKGLAYPNLAFSVMHDVLLARFGITGPPEVFEGNKGFMKTISGQFAIDWHKENLEAVCHTILKKYNAEIHSQSTVEAILAMREANRLNYNEVNEIEIETFDVAYNIIGGGEEGNKHHISLKEQADHSLPYMIAVALIDGELTPEQYRPDRIKKDDVQNLLARVKVRINPDYCQRFPDLMPVRIRVTLKDGRSFSEEREDYEGFHTRPMSWERVVQKFNKLANAYASPVLCKQIASAVETIETSSITRLIQLMSEVRRSDGAEERFSPPIEFGIYDAGSRT